MNNVGIQIVLSDMNLRVIISLISPWNLMKFGQIFTNNLNYK